MISCDKKYFFPIENNILFSFQKIDYDSNYYINDSFTNNYSIELWRNYIINKNASVYRDFTIDELDPEVEDLVHSLNKSVQKLLHIVYDFKDIFQLTSHKNLWQDDPLPRLILKTYDSIVGEEAYAAASKLVKYLESEF